MKIVLDNDATVTNYEEFIDEHAVPYFRNRYNLAVENPDALEIEDIFNLSSHFPDDRVKSMLDSFWISFRFVQYTLLSRFRPGAADTIRRFIRQRHNVEVHTSRAKTCDRSVVGYIARVFTIGQYWLNGVLLSPSHFHFYKSDEEKIEGVVSSRPALIFEDKPYLIKQFAEQGIHVICVSGRHNQSIIESSHVICTNSFRYKDVLSKMETLLGNAFLHCANHGAISNHFYNKLFCFRPIVQLVFRPIIINRENIIQTDSSVIYVSNHRSTLDPIILTSVLKEPIHWAALKRFFDAEDSIFNNSKSPILCKTTAWLFHKLAFFPIERKRDNPSANNYKSIRDMTVFLRAGYKIGIFPEGTTRKPIGHDFGTFDPSFLALARKTGAHVQPITVMWISTPSGKRIVVNFGEAFVVSSRRTEEDMEHFLIEQKTMLQEIKEYEKLHFCKQEK